MLNRSLNDGPGVERLGAPECWQLLDTRSFGRISFCVKNRVTMVLTSYVVRDTMAYFRAAAFGPVARLAESREVTLQVDDMVGNRPARWSVTVTGSCRRVSDAATLAALWSPVRPTLWDTVTEPIWVELTGNLVLGQRKRRPDDLSPDAVPLASS
jgi:uncharacterized protein